MSITEKPKRGAPFGSRNAAKKEQKKSVTIRLPVATVAKLDSFPGTTRSEIIEHAINLFIDPRNISPRRLPVKPNCCERCDYPIGDDWLDDGETCPKCKLVN